jgi:hypothetical protein
MVRMLMGRARTRGGGRGINMSALRAATWTTADAMKATVVRF